MTDPRSLHQLDQTVGAAKIVVAALGDMVMALRDRGFTHAEAVIFVAPIRERWLDSLLQTHDVTRLEERVGSLVQAIREAGDG